MSKFFAPLSVSASANRIPRWRVERMRTRAAISSSVQCHASAAASTSQRLPPVFPASNYKLNTPRPGPDAVKACHTYAATVVYEWDATVSRPPTSTGTRISYPHPHPNPTGPRIAALTT
ncbi:hypothetical protein B0H12DRAFT_544687 [Mycena haematopus]|nr:hypothetical protein B0H12DRAFT_544687 [Mycena haematopus]